MSFTQQPLESGTMVTLWHGNRGLQYVIVGFNRRAKTLGLIRATCFNNDGDIHQATKSAGKFHIETPIESFFEGTKVAVNVNRVYGTKIINRAKLAAFVRRDIKSRSTVALTTDHEIYTPVDVTADSRESTVFA